jgi:lysyl-tRNA synthetase class II
MTLKVEKNECNGEKENWYDIVEVEVNEETFKDEFSALKTGDIVGVKGRIKNFAIAQNAVVTCERLQIF